MIGGLLLHSILVQQPQPLHFAVGKVFTLGSPLGLVLAAEQTRAGGKQGDGSVPVPAPACAQLHNLYLCSDPLAYRLEPLLAKPFRNIQAVDVVRLGLLCSSSSHSFSSQIFLPPPRFFQRKPSHNRFPHGIGSSYELVETLRQHEELFAGEDASAEAAPAGWWGDKRVDFELPAPAGMDCLPMVGLLHLLHASYWENRDAVAHIHREILGERLEGLASGLYNEVPFILTIPREDWQQRRRRPVREELENRIIRIESSAKCCRSLFLPPSPTTNTQLNVAQPNHRCMDTIVEEGAAGGWELTAKFCYGRLSLVNLVGERVAIYMLQQHPAPQWTLLGTETTGKRGRVRFQLAERLPAGTYPIKMVVLGDHTMAEGCLEVVPPRRTEAVVFSIDGETLCFTQTHIFTDTPPPSHPPFKQGAFAESLSLSGGDPRVRPGAVDVVRFWRDAGYFILYVSSRPERQKPGVVNWLARHNFPHGLCWFSEALSRKNTKPEVGKLAFLQGLQQRTQLAFVAGYGSVREVELYTALGLPPERIFCQIRSWQNESKQEGQFTSLADGYTEHLRVLRRLISSERAPSPGVARMARMSRVSRQAPQGADHFE